MPKEVILDPQGDTPHMTPHLRPLCSDQTRQIFMVHQQLCSNRSQPCDRTRTRACCQGDMAAGNIPWWQKLILCGKPISGEPPAALGLELAAFIDKPENLQCLNCFCFLRSVIKLFKLGRLDKV